MALSKIIDKVKDKAMVLFKPRDQVNLVTPRDLTGKFILYLGKTVIGYLTLKDGTWTFEYSDDAKSNDRIRSIVDFPDKNRKYENRNLWPFFSVRIPGLDQPKVINKIKRKNIDQNNEFELLKEFGIETISNPFKLKVVN